MRRSAGGGGRNQVAELRSLRARVENTTQRTSLSAAWHYSIIVKTPVCLTFSGWTPRYAGRHLTAAEACDYGALPAPGPACASKVTAVQRTISSHYTWKRMRAVNTQPRKKRKRISEIILRMWRICLYAKTRTTKLYCPFFIPLTPLSLWSNPSSWRLKWFTHFSDTSIQV